MPRLTFTREEPSLPDIGRHVRYEEVGGELFVRGVDGKDVRQHRLGDCFFLSALASLAQRRPHAIEEGIREHDDGRVTVRFYRRRREVEGFEPVYITVTKALPEAGDRPIVATSTARGELWVPLFEKAYAGWLGGYGVLDAGGDARHAVEALTGRLAHLTWLEHADADHVLRLLEESIAGGLLTTASTYLQDAARASLASKVARGAIPKHLYDPESFEYARHGLVEGHEYTVWGLHEEGGQRMIRLHNPWCYFEPRGNGRDDGMFSLPFDRFLLIFDTVCSGG
jgi:hypothetical protein